MGTAEYAPEKDAIIWTIKQFAGGKEYALRAHFGLPSIEAGMMLFHDRFSYLDILHKTYCRGAIQKATNYC